MELDEKGYRGNTNIRPKGLKQEWTKEQVFEFVKCSKDPVYFIKKYIKIVHVDDGIIPFELWDFQEEFVDILHKNRRVIGLWARQQGKCFCFSETINIRNKKTNEIVSISIGDFYEMAKREKTESKFQEND